MTERGKELGYAMIAIPKSKDMESKTLSIT